MPQEVSPSARKSEDAQSDPLGKFLPAVGGNTSPFQAPAEQFCLQAHEGLASQGRTVDAVVHIEVE